MYISSRPLFFDFEFGIASCEKGGGELSVHTVQGTERPVPSQWGQLLSIIACYSWVAPPIACTHAAERPDSSDNMNSWAWLDGSLHVPS